MDSYDCKICLRRFKTKYSLKIHMTRHTEKKRHIPDECGTESTELCFSKRHTRVDKENRHKCTLCKKTFSYKSHLKQHYITHSGDKPFVCVTCGKSFARMLTLRRHYTIHTGEKPHTCKVCGKSFGRKDGLNKHEKIHIKEKLSVCKTDGKENKSVILNKKSVITGGEEPHISKIRKMMNDLKFPKNFGNGQILHRCQTCGKTFSQRQSLKNHEILHPKVKPNTSPFDIREISLHSTVNISDKIDSGDKLYSRSNSSMSFSQSKQSELHMESHRIKDWDQYDSISFAITEYFGNSEKEDGFEMFSDMFETNSITSIMETNSSSVLLSPELNADIKEKPIQSNFEISADNLHTMYGESQLKELELMSIEELCNPQQFFF